MKRHRLNISQRQRGQAMVVVVIFIAVVLIGFLVLFNSGQLTRQKMEVQNAADAAAYSAALLYARQLNFMAYTNRAMIANEAAIGQLFAFTSWAAKYKLGKPKGTTSLILFEQGLYATLRFLLSPLDSIPALGTAASETAARIITRVLIQFITAPTRAAHVISTTIGSVMKAISNALLPAFSVFNKSYGYFNLIMRGATMAAQVQIVPELISANANGAKLSNFGALAMVLSLAEQHQNFLYKTDAKGGNDKEAQQRYVALVNDARDPWTRDRHRSDMVLGPVSLPSPPIVLTFGPVVATIGFEVEIGVGWPNEGGTALRLLDAPATNNNSNNNQQNNDEEKKQKAAWSSVDTIAFGLEGGVDICFEVQPSLLDLCSGMQPIFDLFQVSEGGASAELTSKKGPTLGVGRLDKWREGEYGNLNWNTTAAVDAIAPGKGGRFGGYQSPVNKKHAGLPTFYDIDPDNYGGADKAPVFLIGVRKDTADLRTSDNLPDKPQGRFDLDTRGAGYLNNAFEGNMESIVEAHARRLLTDFISDQIPLDDIPSVPGTNIKRRISDFIDGLIDDVARGSGDLADVILEPVEETIGSNQPAVFALSAARVYFKNPQTDDEVGSTFNPYWEVTLQPVDDNIRKWSLASQDPKFNTYLSYLTFKDGFDDPRKESSGIDGNQGNLEMFIGEPGNL